MSDVSALMDILDAGGVVRGVRGLHSKVFIFGDTAAAVTSANLTRRGLDHNAEFGCISEESAFMSACRAYFDDLWARSGPSATYSQLEEWQTMVDDFLASGARPGSRRGLPDYGANSDESATEPLPDDAVESTGSPPAWLAEANRAHIKIFGEKGARVPWTFQVLDEVDESGSHWACTYPRNRGRPRNVDDGDAMYLSRMVEAPDDYLIFGRAAALAHDDERDLASPEELAYRPWKEQWPYYIRVHDAEFVAGTLSNGVPLSDLVNELGSDAFATTQENARRGSGNTNPRLALRQQAAVRLSPDGFAWMNQRFEAALERHGRLPADGLRGLDWPTPS